MINLAVMNKIAELSVFFPAYNEEANIRATVEKALSVLQNIATTYEVVIINDGSKDNTAKEAAALAKQYPHVRVINQDNLGYGGALRTGFYNAKYATIVYTDSDGQFDFAEVEGFLNKIARADAVWGYRIKRMDPPIRLLNALGWKWLIWLFFGIKIRDVDCGFKMIRRDVLSKIPKLESTYGGMINPELLVKITRSGLKFDQVGVHHYPRRAGSPTGASPRVIMISLTELLKLWWKIHSGRAA